jgi:hypothetical protein
MAKKKQGKRSEERVSAALPVDLGGAIGITRDVSASGLFFETDVAYVVGGQISLGVALETPSGRMVLKCHGTIIRIESRDHKVGVAVKITESTLVPEK